MGNGKFKNNFCTIHLSCPFNCHFTPPHFGFPEGDGARVTFGQPKSRKPEKATKLRPPTDFHITPSALYKYSMVSMESKLLSMPPGLTGTPQNNLLFRHTYNLLFLAGSNTPPSIGTSPYPIPCRAFR